MITFKHFNKYFCGILVLVCCLFSGIKTAEALSVDGKCLKMSIPAGTVVNPNYICQNAGLGPCLEVSGSFNTYASSDCSGVGSPTIIGAAGCNTNQIPMTNRESVMATNLNCKMGKWGIVPQPDNVPGDFEQSIKNATDWILGFVAMIAVLMLIWGGINYLTSAGDEDKAKTGKKTISYAIIGLVVAGIAYAIVNVIITVIL